MLALGREGHERLADGLNSGWLLAAQTARYCTFGGRLLFTIAGPPAWYL